jgi:signal transduction histidine kinase
VLFRSPEPPPLTDPLLREIDARLRRRAREVSDVVKQDQRARAAIDHARELRTRFMASMSHELRSPLNSIVGFAQLLEEGMDGELAEGQRESVQMIRRGAEELIRLLTDVLDLARLEAGKLHLDREWVPSVELLTEAVTRGQAMVEGRDVEIEAELQPGLPAVRVDRRRILQSVLALFRHASLAMRRTTIRLRARVAPGPPGPDPQLRLELYDAVGAIPAAEVARIFEAFQEITAPTGRRVGGLGMALSLSRELVRLHGGEVWADSVPGAGTIICVALPLEDGTAEP